MRIIKSAFLVFIFVFLLLNSFAQNPALKFIDAGDLKRHLEFLSSDSLQGRAFETPVPGLEMAAEYLKKNGQIIGLIPAFPDYFQTFPVFSAQPDFENYFLELTDSLGNVLFRTDSIVGLPADAGVQISNAGVVFAGFGYQDEKTGYDDFRGIDISGKVVIFTAGTPESVQKKEVPGWNNSLETAKIERAKKAGALMVIIISNPLDTGNTVYNRISRWANRKDFSLEISGNKNENYQFLLTTSSLAGVLPGVKERLANLTEEKSPEYHSGSYLLEGLRININIERKIKTFQAKNVVGFIEGSHPELKNECIVFMAHYDHLGNDASGGVFNGADDNGSGTVALLEVAEAFMSLDSKPKRSLVFLWVTAEEVGLLGSGYYAKNPVFPINKTVACINIDMAGRVFEPRDTIWNKSAKMVKDFDGIYSLTNDIWPGLKKISNSVCRELGLIPDNSLPASFLQSSDHFSFHRLGVPIINYSTGYHADYHKQTDEISRINFDKMKRVADLCFLVGLEIANLKKIEYSNHEKK